VFEKTIILPAFFPSSMENAQHFLNAIKLIGHNIKSIYLGAMAAKQKNLNLSSINKDLREESVQEMKNCIDDAYFYGSHTILINSGRSPDNGEDEIALP